MRLCVPGVCTAVCCLVPYDQEKMLKKQKILKTVMSHKMVDRKVHLDLNQGPIDMQSIAQPLTYTPFYT